MGHFDVMRHALECEHSLNRCSDTLYHDLLYVMDKAEFEYKFLWEELYKSAETKAENTRLRRAAERDADVLESLSGQLEDARAENERLRKEIETERLENGWAREFIDGIAPKCGTKDCPSLVTYVHKLESENAKLTDQMKEMWDLVNHRTTYDHVTTLERMKELGIEVCE